MTLFQKPITDYLEGSQQTRAAVDHSKSPASEFLEEVNDLCDAVHHCKRKFPRKNNGEFTKDSSDSFERLVMASFALMMSHFERFQREQFAALIDWSFAFSCPEPIELAKNLEKAGCELSLPRVLVGPGDEGEIGEIVADAMPGWHNSARVNAYFKAIIPAHTFYSNAIVAELDKLWQLRHSIVHSGGLLTKADAIKVTGLSGFANRQIKFGEGFMPAIGRRMHIVVQKTLTPLKDRMENLLLPLPDEPEEERQSAIASMVGYQSRRPSWFR